MIKKISVLIIFIIIFRINIQADDIKIDLRDFVNAAVNILIEDKINGEDINNSLDKIRKLQCEISPDSVNYIIIIDTTKPVPKMILHPTALELENKVLDDPDYNCEINSKENIFKILSARCEKDGEGFVEYLWPKPTKNGLLKDQKKIFFGKLLKEYNWIICSSTYLE